MNSAATISQRRAAARGHSLVEVPLRGASTAATAREWPRLPSRLRRLSTSVTEKVKNISTVKSSNRAPDARGNLVHEHVAVRVEMICTPPGHVGPTNNAISGMAIPIAASGRTGCPRNLAWSVP
jgi:hypothetical protein